MAAITSCAGEGVHDGVEERDLSVALRAGPRRNRNGRKETEENGPEDEENEVDKRRMVFMDAQGLYNSYIISKYLKSFKSALFCMSDLILINLYMI